MSVAAPRRADAERAAAALAAAGVGRVVLFGSVARGDAGERSDIDLMAIYDDLDYGERWERRCELAGLAGRAAGFPVDVSVTDSGGVEDAHYQSGYVVRVPGGPGRGGAGGPPRRRRCGLEQGDGDAGR